MSSWWIEHKPRSVGRSPELSLCGRVLIGPPRRCYWCEAEGSGAWILRGQIEHRERPSAKCHAPAPSQRRGCWLCAHVEQAATRAETRGRLRGVALELARERERAKKRWPEDWGRLPMPDPNRAGSARRR